VVRWQHSIRVSAATVDKAKSEEDVPRAASATSASTESVNIIARAEGASRLRRTRKGFSVGCLARLLTSESAFPHALPCRACG
jgi:hypothetical protein